MRRIYRKARQALKRVANPLHSRLMQREGRYFRWHNYKHHKKVHVGILVAYIGAIGILISQTFSPILSYAATGTWNFSNSGDYTYDNTKIDIAGNQASLKTNGTPGTNWIATDSGHDWGFRKEISISKTNVGSALTNFPLKVEISGDADIGAHAKSDLTDLRFTSSDLKTILPAEKETGTVTTGYASGIFWVQIPSISTSADTVFYVYYGNSSASAQANPSTAWDSSFKGVWHLPNGSALTANDSTSFAENATAYAGVSATTGKIDGAAQFNNSSTGYAQSSDASLPSGNSARTISCWFKSSAAKYQQLFVWGTKSDARASGVWIHSNGHFYTGTYSYDLDSGVSVIDGNWHYGVASYDGTTWRTYVDGTPTLTGSLTTNTTLGYMRMGTLFDRTDFYLNGSMDEAHVSDSARPADWIKFEYYNQKDTAGQLSFGSQVILSSIDHAPGSGWIATDSGQNWNFRKSITIDHTKVAANQTDFPVLVSISSDADLASNAKSDGTDIRFTASGNITALNYERESYSVTGGHATGVFWVKASLSASVDTVLYLYYGNSAAADGQNATAVWSKGYVGVWHLDTGLSDSTSGGHTATLQNSAALSSSQSKFGGSAVSLPNVAGNATVIPSNADWAFGTGAFTVESWVYLSAAQSHIFFSYNGSNNQGALYADSNGVVGYFQGGDVITSAAGAVGTSQWYHIVYTGDGASNRKMYVNNQQVGSTNTGAYNYAAKILWFGANQSLSSQCSNGYQDEIRVSKGNAHSIEWVSTEYANQNSPETFASIGVQNGINSAEVGTFSNVTSNATAQGYNIISGFSATSSGTGSVKFQVSADGGTSWYWWNGSAWTATTAGSWETNTAADINTHFADSSFNSMGSAPKTFKWRAYFISDGTQQPILSAVNLTYLWDTLAPPNPTLTPTSQKTGGTPITTGNWYNYANPNFAWTAVADVASEGEQPSGTAGYYIYFGTDNSAIPTSARGMAVEVGGTGIHYQTGTGFEVGVDSSAMSTGSTYYLRAQTKDVAGNTSGAQTLFTYKYDNLAPESPRYVSVSPSGYTRTNHFVFSWPVSGSDGPSDTGGSSLAKYQYKVGTGAWTDVPGDSTTSSITLDNPAYQTGTNNFYLRAVDIALNADLSPTQTNFYFNASAPSAPRSLTADPSTSDSNSFSFSWNPPSSYSGSVAGYYYSINVLPTDSNSTFTTQTTLADGPYASQQGQNTLYLVAKDEAGNYSFDSCNNISGNPDQDSCAKVDFVANTAAPGIPTGLQAIDTSNRDAKEYSDVLKWLAPTNNGTGFAGYSVERSADNSTFVQIATTSGTAYVDDGLSSQLYYYRIRGRDNANQYGAYSSTVSITPTGRYTQPPALVNAPVAATKAFSVQIKWDTDREASTIIKYSTDQNSLSQESSHATEFVKNHDISVLGLTPETTYYYKAIWIDSDGNQGTSDLMSFETGLRPKISDVKISNITLSSAMISWTSTTVSTSTVTFGKTVSYGGSVTDKSGSQTTNHTVNLDSLADSSTYHFQIVGTDTDGNLLASDDYTFDTLVKPVISNFRYEPVQDAPTTTLKISFNSNVPTTTIVGYSAQNGNSLSKSDSNYVTDHSIEIASLQDKSVYSFEASGVDQHGNSASADRVSFTTPEDTRPPKIADLSIEVKQQGVGNTQKAQIVVTWTTDEPATSQVQYAKGISGTDYNNKTKEDGSLSTYHAVIVSELDPSTIYHLQAISADASGNKSSSEGSTTITGKIQQSVVDIIVNSLELTLGRLFGFWTKQ